MMKIIEVAENLLHIVRVENVPNKKYSCIQIERKARKTWQTRNINPTFDGNEENVYPVE